MANLRALLRGIISKHTDAAVSEAIDTYRRHLTAELGDGEPARRKPGPRPKGTPTQVKAGRRSAPSRHYRCRVPGCPNNASPRFDLFCVTHKDSLGAAEKARIKAEQKSGSGAAAAASSTAPRAARKGAGKGGRKSGRKSGAKRGARKTGNARKATRTAAV